MQPAHQFTPDQLIVAGRRAEHQGNVAYAMQFYRHVAAHHANSAEAFEARDALARLAAATPPAAAPSAGVSPVAAGVPATQAAFEPLRAERAAASPSPASAPRRQAARGAAREVATENVRERGFRIGRFVAMMLGTIGWLLTLGAVVALPLVGAVLFTGAGPKAAKAFVSGSLPLIGAAILGALVTGLLAIAAAQVARATFDTADLTRWMASTMTGERDQP